MSITVQLISIVICIRAIVLQAGKCAMNTLCASQVRLQTQCVCCSFFDLSRFATFFGHADAGLLEWIYIYLSSYCNGHCIVCLCLYLAVFCPLYPPVCIWTNSYFVYLRFSLSGKDECRQHSTTKQTFNFVWWLFTAFAHLFHIVTIFCSTSTHCLCFSLPTKLPYWLIASYV